jgi:DNA polymerase-3 subunit epsilon
MLIGGFDTETTGLLKPEHRFVEVCLIQYDYDPATGWYSERDVYTQRINPERPIDPDATKVHGILASDLVGKPKAEEVLPILRNKLDECQVVVGHNELDFDLPFLIKELERLGLALPDFTPFDTMIEGRWATPFGKAPSLKELCWASGERYVDEEAHAAEYDVRRMMACFFFGLKRGVFNLSTI